MDELIALGSGIIGAFGGSFIAYIFNSGLETKKKMKESKLYQMEKLYNRQVVFFDTVYPLILKIHTHLYKCLTIEKNTKELQNEKRVLLKKLGNLQLKHNCHLSVDLVSGINNVYMKCVQCDPTSKEKKSNFEAAKKADKDFIDLIREHIGVDKLSNDLLEVQRMEIDKL